jgi:hypothetical protein
VPGFYVINSLLWSFVGAVIGYKYCKMQLDVNEMKRRLHMASDSPSNGAPVVPVEAEPPVPEESQWALHKPNMQQLIGIIVVVMAIVSVSVAVGYSRQLNSVSTCLNGYVNAYNSVLKDRDTFANQSRTSLRDYIVASDDLWAGFLKNAPAPGETATSAQRDASIAVLSQYFAKSKIVISALDATSAARLRFPIPDNHCPDSQ